MLNVLISFQYPFSYPLKNFKTDSQIKEVPAAEAKLGARGHPPTAGTEASSTERKSPQIYSECPCPGQETRARPCHSQAGLGKEKQSPRVSLTSTPAGGEALGSAPAREHGATPPPRNSRRDTAHRDAQDLAISDTRRHF